MRTCLIVCACVTATLVVVFGLTFLGDDPPISAFGDDLNTNTSRTEPVLFTAKGKGCPPMHKMNVDGKCRLVMGAAIRSFAAGGVFVIALAALMGFTIYRTRVGHPQRSPQEHLEGADEPLREGTTQVELQYEKDGQNVGLTNKQNIVLVQSRR